MAAINVEDHRIYTNMSVPISFVGLTVDELGVVLASLIGATQSMGKASSQLLWIVIGAFGVGSLKKLKRLNVGFNIKSFLIFYGVAAANSQYWPSFKVRKYK